MKKILMLLLGIILVLPIAIKADQVKYLESIKTVNDFISDKAYKDRDRYLLMEDLYFEYDNTGLKQNIYFRNGGLLNKYEFEISKLDGSSYLAPGIEYWTMTQQDSMNQYYVGNDIRYKDKSEESNIRVTEYVKPETRVKGSGTSSNPWEFVKLHYIVLQSNNVSYGTVNGEAYISVGLEERQTSLIVNLSPTTGHKYVKSNGCKTLFLDGNRYVVDKILDDTDCVAVFDTLVYKYTLMDTYTDNLTPNPIYYKYNEAWYDKNDIKDVITKVPVPTRRNYKFEGYYTGQNGSGEKVIDETGKIIDSYRPKDNTINKDLYAKWTKIAIDCDPGYYLKKGNTECSSCEIDYYCPGANCILGQDEDCGNNKCPINYFSNQGAITCTKCEYTITFDANGGSDLSQSDKVLLCNSTYGALPTTTRTGYTFDGWYTEKTGGTKITSSSTFDIRSDQTLYAQWTINSYTLKLKGELDGTERDDFTDTYTKLVYGKFDVKIDGKKVASNASSFSKSIPYGSEYEITIKKQQQYKVNSDTTISGTMPAKNKTIKLSFSVAAYVALNTHGWGSNKIGWTNNSADIMKLKVGNTATIGFTCPSGYREDCTVGAGIKDANYNLIDTSAQGYSNIELFDWTGNGKITCGSKAYIGLKATKVGYEIRSAICFKKDTNGLTTNKKERVDRRFVVAVGAN